MSSAPTTPRAARWSCSSTAGAGHAEYVKTTCKEAALGIGGIARPRRGKVGNPFAGRIDEVRISNVVRDHGGRRRPYEPDDRTRRSCSTATRPRRPAAEQRRAGPQRVRRPALFGENGTLVRRLRLPGALAATCAGTRRARSGWSARRRRRSSCAAQDVRRAPAMVHRWITPSPLYMPGPPQTRPAAATCTLEAAHADRRPDLLGLPLLLRLLRPLPQDASRLVRPGLQPASRRRCATRNPGFIHQVVQDARDYFDGKGIKPGATAAGDVFGLVPMDNSSWCKCPRCQAELNRAEEKNQQFNNGKASDYVFGFVEPGGPRGRARRHPDKWIGALAYSDYAYYPAKEPGRAERRRSSCACTRGTGGARRWRSTTGRCCASGASSDPDRPLYLWLYYCFPALNAQFGGFHYFPGYFAHTVVPQMKLYHDARIEGIFMENSSECDESYLMDQLEFYVTLKLADDPSWTANRSIDEFFTRYYGAAAGPMKELYWPIEETFCESEELSRSRSSDPPPTSTRPRSWPGARWAPRSGWAVRPAHGPGPRRPRDARRERAGRAVREGPMGIHAQRTPLKRHRLSSVASAPGPSCGNRSHLNRLCRRLPGDPAPASNVNQGAAGGDRRSTAPLLSTVSAGATMRFWQVDAPKRRTLVDPFAKRNLPDEQHDKTHFRSFRRRPAAGAAGRAGAVERRQWQLQRPHRDGPGPGRLVRRAAEGMARFGQPLRHRRAGRRDAANLQSVHAGFLPPEHRCRGQSLGCHAHV